MARPHVDPARWPLVDGAIHGFDRMTVADVSRRHMRDPCAFVSRHLGGTTAP
jgi:hypothetical protein